MTGDIVIEEVRGNIRRTTFIIKIFDSIMFFFFLYILLIEVNLYIILPDSFFFANARYTILNIFPIIL